VSTLDILSQLATLSSCLLARRTVCHGITMTFSVLRAMSLVTSMLWCRTGCTGLLRESAGRRSICRLRQEGQ